MKQSNWENRLTDLADAQRIIDKYIDLNDGEPLVLEIDLENGSIYAPEWIDEMQDYFIEKYGLLEGDGIVAKILSYCVIGNQTVH